MNLNRKLTLGSAFVVLAGLGMRAYVRSARSGKEAQVDRMVAQNRAAAKKHADQIASLKAQAAALRTGIASCDALLALTTHLDECPTLTPDVRVAIDALMKASSAEDMDTRCTNALPALKQRATTLGCTVE